MTQTNIEKIYKGGNAYIDTFYIYDHAAGHFVGILEEHGATKKRYFVGWKFPKGRFLPNTSQCGKTAVFDNETGAMNYIIGEQQEENDDGVYPDSLEDYILAAIENAGYDYEFTGFEVAQG